jgi:uncharacterized membrane protein
MTDLGGKLDVRVVPPGNGWVWITDSWKLFLKQPGLWVLMFIIMMVIMVVLSWLGFIGQLAGALIIPILGGGFVLAARTAEQGGSVEIAMLFEGFKAKAAPLAMVGVLNLAAWLVIALVVGLFVGFGAGMGAMMGGAAGGMVGMSATALLAMLVALALSVPVAAAIWFAPALVMFRDIAPVEAVKESFAACLKNLIPFLVFGVAALVLSVVASIPFGLGWLALGPVLGISVYTAYKDLFGG